MQTITQPAFLLCHVSVIIRETSTAKTWDNT
ncbi:hypothetical protein CIPAW_14G132400 [Carya illinoinensis]|uniref:Uncharacterized protein n=1 Tax=Carya illinoinensis TaxID=32201 RepID=A0A8T1NE78_CARIL|nr:hypothetical protein CIPAW_14G132400 [Carya illinoinensis]